jgi:hypothetical protein
MKRVLNRNILPVAVLILGAVFGFLLPSGFSSSQGTAKRATPGKAHSVTYRVREYRHGQLQVEKIVLRSVNEKGEWRKETIWPTSGSGVEYRLDGHYALSKGSKSLISTNGIAAGAYFQTPSETIRQTAEVKEIAGLKAYLIHSENGDLVLDEAFSDETGMTPLWSHIINRKTGLEIVSEALDVIWGVKDF